MFRRQAGRMVAHLARRFGPSHLEAAEEAVQAAMLRALQTWPFHGVPENPEAWLFRVAQNSAIDTLRRGRWVTGNIDDLTAERAPADSREPGDADFEEQVRDDELRMIFMCSHPELSRDASVALSLKVVGGLSAREIARAFLADVAAIEQRIVRAKRTIRDRGLTLELPRGAELEARLDAALEVIYFIFNEGYAAHQGEDLIRHDLCKEALRLGLLVAESMDDARADALVAFMALQAARSPARIDAAGDLILLEEQDRSRWDAKLIALGFHYFDRSMRGERVSEYHTQAAIAATHARANDLDSTGWPLILGMYDQLFAMNGSPVVALNRAVAIAKVRGAAAGLEATEPLANDPALGDYYLLLAVRGHLLLELKRNVEAAECFREALSLSCSEPERRLLRRKLEQASI
ncbi:MAG TPA: sigma-70 family RNA polymerase sigma factor [Bryobacteraceae bacterium]|nr:sigma-70 family RNA polymerase sigma factor [Bryobacteraceae bacterium]